MGKKNKKEKREKSNKPLRKWAVFTGLAFQMGATIGVAVYIGILLDEKYSKNFPLYTIILAFLGIFGAIYTVMRQIKKINKKDDTES